MPDAPRPDFDGPITLVIFDLDGVLCDWQPRRRLELLSRISGKDPEWIQQATFNSSFETDAEAGAYPTGEAYLAEFNRRLEFPLSREQWVAARQAAMQPSLPMVELVRSLLGRVSVAVLTNNGALLRDTMPLLMPELYSVLGSHIHVSCDLGARKPDPAVYLRLLDRYHRRPEEALFIDDSERNVRGAREAGLRGLRFTSASELIEQLKTRLSGIS
jgi:putative hydrolase of the HAD superfamily